MTIWFHGAVDWNITCEFHLVLMSFERHNNSLRTRAAIKIRYWLIPFSLNRFPILYQTRTLSTLSIFIFPLLPAWLSLFLLLLLLFCLWFYFCMIEFYLSLQSNRTKERKTICVDFPLGRGIPRASRRWPQSAGKHGSGDRKKGEKRENCWREVQLEHWQRQQISDSIKFGTGAEMAPRSHVHWHRSTPPPPPTADWIN